MKTRRLSVLIFTVGLISLNPALAATPDACTLLTSADAQTALGEPVGPAKTEDRSFGKGNATSCRYRSTDSKSFKGRSVSLEVRHSDDDLTGSAKGIAQNLESSGFKNVHQIPGVGSAAVWASNSIFGKSQGELTVIEGKSVMLIIFIEGLSDEATAMANAQIIARQALDKF